MPKAAPSTRTLARDITLSFGLVNIPVNIFTGTVSDAGISRHEYLPVEKEDGTGTEDHPVGRGQIDKVTGALLGPDQLAKVVKKIDTEYGPVYVEDAEIEKLFTLEPDTLKINTFQPQHLFYQGHYVPKNLMFIEPNKTGTGKKKGFNAATLKLFGTLLKAMREEGVVAIGELTTRGVPKPVILTPDGALWQVWHTNSLREQRELPEADLNPAEIKMMGTLIDALKTTEPKDLSDVRSELIQNFANEKAEAGEFDRPVDTYQPKTTVEAAPDLMAMLAASVEQAKQAS